VAKLYNTDNPERYFSVQRENWGAVTEGVEYLPFAEFKMREYSGKHFTISDFGARSNGSDGITPIAENGNPLIYVFGGSTTFGHGVDNTETIPAYLEDWIVGAGHRDYRVVNFGTIGAFSTQERILFQNILYQLPKPKIAVFIDGLNGFLFCAIPDKSMISHRISRNFQKAGGGSFGRVLASRSNVVKLWKFLTEAQPIDRSRVGADCYGGSEKAAALVRRLTANRTMIKAVAEQFGISTYFVQQPVPAFAFADSDRVVAVPPTPVDYGMVHDAYEMMSAAKNGSEDTLADSMIWLETLRIEENMYIDEIHYSPQFNREIARHIYRAISHGL